MNNKVYFEYSQTHEDILNNNIKPEGVLVINRNETEPETLLMKANTKLTECITAYKIMRNLPSCTEENRLNIIDDIIYIIENTDLINYSPFCVYLQVVGYSFSSYNSEKNKLSRNEKRNLIESYVNLYIDNRHDLYLYHGYSNQVLQVNSDASSSRRKGKLGIEIMEKILTPYGFIKVKNFRDLLFNDYCYLLPDKGDKELFNYILEKNNIDFTFRKSRDNKNPDMFIKIKNDYYILEHKLTNGGGGSQNAEVNEIIQFINYSENNENWHYISCLQGDFFKKLHARNTEPKIKSQYSNILTNLNSHPNNFFVNGKGFEKLIFDLVKTKSQNKLDDVVNI